MDEKQKTFGLKTVLYHIFPVVPKLKWLYAGNFKLDGPGISEHKFLSLKVRHNQKGAKSKESKF